MGLILYNRYGYSATAVKRPTASCSLAKGTGGTMLRKTTAALMTLIVVGLFSLPAGASVPKVLVLEDFGSVT